jgi:ABC-type sugar transport system ATPase subunit
VAKLGVAERQVVQIAKAISLKVEILIMDEPTAALTDTEVETLFNLIRQLREEGVSIIYISHRLDEVLSIADRITVLRNGKNIGTIQANAGNKAKLIHMMVGRDIEELYPKQKVPIGDTVLELRNVASSSTLRDISFSLRAGEILGFAGLLGSGVRDLAYIVAGMEQPEKGDIVIFDKKVRFSGPKDAMRAGIGFLPEDRRRIGLCMGLSVGENITMAGLEKWSRSGIINQGKTNQVIRDYVARLSIKTSNVNNPITSLSGGNQQKVVIAKWLANGSKILILYEPTFGVDIGAKAEIYTIMSNLARAGVGILMISSDMPELISMSDRIICMHKGGITKEILVEGNITENEVRAHL